MARSTEAQYLVLPNSINPYLLARVRWPDVAQAISALRPEWQGDQGLFDLPYDPSSVTVTHAQAASIAARWGAHLPPDTADPVPSLIRRMPANWSNLTPAEKRAWRLELVAGRRASASRTGRSRSLLRTRSRSSRRSALEPTDQMLKLLSATADESTPGQGRHLVAEGKSHQTRVVAERRRHARMHVHGRALISSGYKTISADLVNVSQGGVHCIVPDAQLVLEAGGKLASPLLLEDHVSKSRVSLDVSATVTWRRDIGPATQFGLAFGELNHEQAEQVQLFLMTLGAGPGS
ncbi:MAG: PilZ domain-containing protein [Acidimicrobiales bacterium]